MKREKIAAIAFGLSMVAIPLGLFLPEGVIMKAALVLVATLVFAWSSKVFFKDFFKNGWQKGLDKYAIAVAFDIFCLISMTTAFFNHNLITFEWEGFWLGVWFIGNVLTFCGVGVVFLIAEWMIMKMK